MRREQDEAVAPIDFVGIGAARCGTTWLARRLADHPDVFVPAQKELHYFNNLHRYEPTLRRLHGQFAAARPGQLRGEYTPRYMLSRDALERINRHAPDAKLIVSLRDPVDRALSQFRYFRLNKKKEAISDFEAALEGHFHEDYVAKGCYAPQIRRVLDLFDRRRIHIVRFEDLCDDPTAVTDELFSFLGLSSLPRHRDLAVRINSSGQRHRAPRAHWASFVAATSSTTTGPFRVVRPLLLRLIASGNRCIDWSPQWQGVLPIRRLAPEFRTRLYNRYFRDDVEETERLLDLDLSAWKPAPAHGTPAPRRAA